MDFLHTVRYCTAVLWLVVVTSSFTFVVVGPPLVTSAQRLSLSSIFFLTAAADLRPQGERDLRPAKGCLSDLQDILFHGGNTNES